MYTIIIYHRYIMIYNYIKILYGVAMGSLNESPGANWYQYDLLIDSMRKLILASSSCLSVQAQGGGRWSNFIKQGHIESRWISLWIWRLNVYITSQICHDESVNDLNNLASHQTFPVANGCNNQSFQSHFWRCAGPVVGATIGIMYWLAITMLSVPLLRQKRRENGVSHHPHRPSFMGWCL